MSERGLRGGERDAERQRERERASARKETERESERNLCEVVIEECECEASKRKAPKDPDPDYDERVCRHLGWGLGIKNQVSDFSVQGEGRREMEENPEEPHTDNTARQHISAEPTAPASLSLKSNACSGSRSI